MPGISLFYHRTRSAFVGIALLTTLAVGISPISRTDAADARPLSLEVLGNPRQLPDHLFGASVEALIEHLLDDPAKIAALGQTAPAVMRFPGGSQSNFYNWQTGQLTFPIQANSSSYMKFWAGVAQKVDQAFPNGVKLEQYAPVAKQVGADVILVPNLETSTVADQVAWFKQLAAENILPQNIELGNEFWIAMGGDPTSLRKWPDEPTSLAVMKQYEEALRPIVGSGGKFAVQASPGIFNYPPDVTKPFQRRQIVWNEALAPAAWFDAVTEHLYPDPETLAASVQSASPQQLLDLFMAHGDAGVDRILNDLAKRVPGKEIWITEWSPRGGNPGDITNPNFHELVPPTLRAQLIVRYELAYLRHPDVTKAQYFTLNFTEKSVFQEYVRSADGKGYVPMAPALMLQWFDDAANGGSTFQRLIEPNGKTVSNVGPFQESYQPIEGGLFTQKNRTILILQNASSEARLYDPSQNGTKPWPSQADLLVTSDLTTNALVAAQPSSLPATQAVTLPPYSILRLIWQQS